MLMYQGTTNTVGGDGRLAGWGALGGWGWRLATKEDLTDLVHLTNSRQYRSHGFTEHRQALYLALRLVEIAMDARAVCPRPAATSAW